MDSVTQAVLGAAVGEAVLGRKVGTKAAIWGAVAGTLPDLDVVAYPFLDEVSKLSWHRGPSHAFFYLCLAAPLVGWAICRLHKGQASWRQWTLLAYLGFITHVLLDAFTVYGTQLFRPFSDYPVAFSTIAIIDPLYSLPLLVGVIGALLIRRGSSRRRIFNWLGIGLSTAYLLTTAGIKANVDGIVERELARQDIGYSRYMTAPTLLNAILWQVTVESDSGYLVSDYSLLDANTRLVFDFVPRNDSLLRPVDASRAVKQLRWFSRGYYAVTQPKGRLLFHDLRFGELNVEKDSSYQYIFSWQLQPPRDPRGEVIMEREALAGNQPVQALERLWVRLLGDQRIRTTESSVP